MAFGWYGVCVWHEFHVFSFLAYLNPFRHTFCVSSPGHLRSELTQMTDNKAFYKTSHLELTINHPRAANYLERLIKIHFTDIICDWTVGGPRKSSELAWRLKSYWPLHLDLTLAGRSGVSKEQPRQSSPQCAQPTSVLFFGGQFRGANRHFYYFYYTQCLKFEAIKPGLIGRIARPSEPSNRKARRSRAGAAQPCRHWVSSRMRANLSTNILLLSQHNKESRYQILRHYSKRAF